MNGIRVELDIETSKFITNSATYVEEGVKSYLHQVQSMN